MRSLSHPHVRTILSVFNRTLASPEASALPGVVSMIVTLTHADEFSCFVRPKPKQWSTDGLRAVLLAYALHAPADELAAMARMAREQLDWLEAFEVRCTIERHGVAIEDVLAPSRIEAEHMASVAVRS